MRYFIFLVIDLKLRLNNIPTEKIMYVKRERFKLSISINVKIAHSL